MVDRINSAIIPLESASSKMNESFTYDDKGADEGFIQKQIDRLRALYNYFNSSVLTEVNRKIEELKQQISDLEAQTDY